jgi:hypothetical protein
MYKLFGTWLLQSPNKGMVLYLGRHFFYAGTKSAEAEIPVKPASTGDEIDNI